MPDYGENQSAGSATIVVGANTQTTFSSNGDAGTASIQVNPGGRVFFREDSTALLATITLDPSNGGSVSYVEFSDRATAGQAAFDVGSRAMVTFYGQSTGATATATVKGSIGFVGTSSAGAMRFAIEAVDTVGGQVGFSNDANAGSAILDNRGGGVGFSGNASAGTATIRNIATQGQTTSRIDFYGTSTAAKASIDSDAGAFIGFNGDAMAGSARIVSRGSVGFTAQASADKSTLTSKGTVTFWNNATAGQATVTNEAGGRIEFRDSATAGSAGILTKAGATTAFLGLSSGGTARLTVEAGGVVDFSGRSSTASNGSPMTAAMILGAGTFYLGNNALTVGGANNSFDVKSLIANFSTPQSAVPGGALVKVGTGTMALSNGANAFTGGITLKGGTLIAAEKGALGTGAVKFDLGAQTFIIQKKALLDTDGTLAFKNAIDNLGVGDQLRLVGAGPVNDASQVYLTGNLNKVTLRLQSGDFGFTVDKNEVNGSGLLGVFQTASGDVNVAFNTREAATGTAGDDTILVIGWNGGTAKGGAGRDRLVGDDGSDILDGGSGADTLRGGHGNDRYVVDNAGDVVDETGGSGTDTVASSVSYTLADGIENLELTGNAAINGTGHAGQNTLIGNGADNILRGGDGDDVLEGGGGDDTLYGSFDRDSSFGRDTLRGGAGDDYMYGGSGVDTFDGGDGYDTVSLGVAIEGEDTPATIDLADPTKNTGKAEGERYISIEEFGLTNAGDTFWADPLSFAGLWIEGRGGNDQITTAGGGDHLDGGAGADRLDGAGGDDYLDGGAGADYLDGGAGDDTYIVDEAADVVVESSGGGIDSIVASISYTLTAANVEQLFLDGLADIDATGSARDDLIIGNFGNNRIDGGQGADRMAGFRGDDTYVVDDAGDQVVEDFGEGFDTLVSTVSYALAAGEEIEQLRLTLATGSRSLNLTGNEFAQTIIGNNGANILDGKGGADVLIGGKGNDTYIVDNARDQVTEAAGAGTDVVGALTSYTLAAGQEIETLRLALSTTTQNLNLTGNEFDQAIIGNSGKNTLNGGGGTDTMTGGKGDDTYIVDSAADRVIEAKGGGSDRVFLTGTYYLASGQEIEALQLLTSTGTAKLNLAGNEFGQTLVGNAGANALDGKGGADVLTGNRGADTFVFSTALGSANVDRITDFASEDTIRLSKSVFAALAPGQLASSAFKNLGTGAADGDDRILYQQATGELFYDADGSGSGAAVKFATLDNKATLTAADFLVA